MFSAERIKELLEENLPDCRAVVIDDVDDGEHFTARVTSSAFVGATRVKQHRLVYEALGGRVGREIHALALQTFTPDDWPDRNGVSP